MKTPTSMTRFRALIIVSSLLIVATMVGGAAIGLRASSLFRGVHDDWQTFDTVSEQKVRYLTKMHTALGYGGLVSHLKDWILHRDGIAQRAVETDMDAIKISIQSYRLLAINGDELKALNKLETVVLEMDTRLKNIPEMLDANVAPFSIDFFLNTDESAAVAALESLRWAWAAQARMVGRKLKDGTQEGQTLIRVGSILLPIVLVIGVLVLWLIQRLNRQIIAYEREKKTLALSERRFRDLAANVPGVIFQWVERRSGDRGYLYVSPRCQEIYGVSPEDLQQNWQALAIHPDDEQRYLDTMRSAFEDKTEWSFEGRFLTPNGEPKWWRGVSKPVPVNDDEIVFNGVIIDISQQKKMEEDLRSLATTDPLTACANRRHFMDLAEKEIQRAQRYKEPLSVLMLDIDHFKKINDTHGHSCGDEALQHFVESVRRMLRDTDVLGRVGGEEFAVMMPETPPSGAAAVAQRICDEVSGAMFQWEDAPITFTVSIGVAKWEAGDKSIDCALARADQALYEAKHSGRNRVAEVTTPDLTPEQTAC